MKLCALILFALSALYFQGCAPTKYIQYTSEEISQSIDSFDSKSALEYLEQETSEANATDYCGIDNAFLGFSEDGIKLRASKRGKLLKTEIIGTSGFKWTYELNHYTKTIPYQDILAIDFDNTLIDFDPDNLIPVYKRPGNYEIYKNSCQRNNPIILVILRLKQTTFGSESSSVGIYNLQIFFTVEVDDITNFISALKVLSPDSQIRIAQPS